MGDGADRYESDERRAERLGEALTKAVARFQKAHGGCELASAERQYRELITTAHDLKDFACSIAAEKRKCVVESWKGTKRQRELGDRIELAKLVLDGTYKAEE